MESETIVTVLKNISSQQDSPFKNPGVFTRNLYMALISNNTLINLLFSGTEKARLGDCLETELKRLICEKYPDYQNDAERTSCFLSASRDVHAYLNNQEKDVATLVSVSESIVRRLAPMYMEEVTEEA